MFEITDSAAKQFQVSVKEMGDNSLSLRVSAKKSPVSGMIYNMGFDKPKDNDETFSTKGISFVVSPDSVDNVKAMVIDFREYEGQEQFVFINPNDQKDSCETSPDGCDPEGNPSCKSCKDED